MKERKNRRITKKPQDPLDDKCMCSVHIAGDKMLNNPIPCIGHGINCPCTKALEEKEATILNPEPQQS